MKTNSIFDKCVANIAPGVMEEVSLKVDIANRIYYLLKKKKMTQREFPSFGDSSSMMRWKSASVLL